VANTLENILLGHRAMQRWCENIFNGVIIAAFGMRLAFENSFTSSGKQRKKKLYGAGETQWQRSLLKL